MSISRHLSLLASLQVFALSCALRTEPTQPHSVSSTVPHWPLVSESRATVPGAGEPRASNPYAPTRSPDPARYFWRTETPTECTDAPATELDSERPLESRAAGNSLAMAPDARSGSTGDPRRVSPDAVVAGLRPALHHCFSRWQDQQLDAEGSARFALELGCAGDVEAISAENRGVDEGALACLFSALGPARFAPPAAGHATLVVPVTFKNAR